MDDALYFMLHGCDLAKRLEPSLRTLRNLQFDELSNSCQEIIGVFTTALDCLNRQNSGGAIELGGFPGGAQREQNIPEGAVTFENELSGSNVNQVVHIPEMDTLLHLKSPEGTTERPCSGRAGLLMRQGSKKRRGFSEKNTIRIRASPIGQKEVIPDDGYTWRKYGQKEILGTKYPRSYYRCTHKTFYGCDAKKQIQRTDADPHMYEITYCNAHTCQTLAPTLMNPAIGSVDPARFEPSPQPASTTAGTQMGSSDEHPVIRSMEDLMLEFEDIIFNSGSSSNSMDSIFSPKGKNERSWDAAQ